MLFYILKDIAKDIIDLGLEKGKELMKNEMLSQEEQQILEKFRAQKKAEEESKRLEEERKSKTSDLEKKFELALAEAHAKINQHLENARQEIKKAEKISEESGIPFSSDVHVFSNRSYWPTTFSKNWEELDKYEIIDKIGGYSYNSNDGWEYWSASSVSC